MVISSGQSSLCGPQTAEKRGLVESNYGTRFESLIMAWLPPLVTFIVIPQVGEEIVGRTNNLPLHHYEAVADDSPDDCHRQRAKNHLENLSEPVL